jgi:triosephosphate isomerase
MRKKIVAGNWKMNKTFEEGMALTSEVVNMVKDEVNSSKVTAILIPPFIHLHSVAALAASTAVAVGAQNCHQAASGAYTGEVSVSMIKSTGATYVILGHSERRAYFGETNTLLAQKTDAVLKENLLPIYCCGETLEERNAGKHFDVIRSQVAEGLFHVSAEQINNVVIAYEPVWAIGTGVTASTAQAQEIHAFIRQLLTEKYGNEVAQQIRILYGGSVKPDNAADLFSQVDIDGGLIGGAALQSRSFVDIVKAAQ